jgi:acetyl-CoA carboxylase biotin carboxylase subunit
MLESLLVANRGEIARRIIRTAGELGVRTIAVYSNADADLPFVREADEAVLLGPAAPAESYACPERIIDAARRTGAQAVHPGYGFLAEDAGFAAAVLDADLLWVGPSPDAIAAMGDKTQARLLMEKAGVPVVPGSTAPLSEVEAAISAADTIGYPVMVKASAGGGGIGMNIANDAEELRRAFETARNSGARFFGNPQVLLERYVRNARHIEVQILGLADGRVVSLGERDCSVQRRHQKVAEETPSPGIDSELRERMCNAAVQAGLAVGYRSAGTIECLYDRASGEFMFLEMNTRLQVEHPVTELVTGIDLVEEQLRVASGEDVSFDANCVTPRGHAFEFRVYAEDAQRFLPSPGLITTWREPQGRGVRVDAGYCEGNTVTMFYDPLLAKLCVLAGSRADAIGKARAAVAGFRIEGVKTNLPFFTDLLERPEFVSGAYDTHIIETMRQ